jgi:hypothetical protein
LCKKSYKHGHNCDDFKIEKKETKILNTNNNNRQNIQNGNTNILMTLHEEEELTNIYFQDLKKNKKTEYKHCKRCKTLLSKTYGCDKMKCLCGYRFCFKCEKENATCSCTPNSHGFWDNKKSSGDFSDLNDRFSP